MAPGIEDLFRAGAALCTGEPFAPSPQFLLAYLGGPGVQRPTGPPRSSDPLDHGYGFYFLWVTCPAVGRELASAIGLVRDASARFSSNAQLTIQLPSGRAAVLVVRICFDRRDAAGRERARRCYRAGLEATLAAGLPPWRLGVEGMALLGRGAFDMGFARRLKAWMDPDAILAPGRYLP